MKPFNYATIGVVIILITIATSPAFALGTDNRNLLLIALMFLSPLVIMCYAELCAKEFLLIFFMLAIIFFPASLHPETMRWSTVLFTCLFCLTFMAYTRLLRHGNLTAEHYLTVIKYLIYTYTIALLIQQFCVLTQIPIFSISAYNPQKPWKLNSLTSEPSNSARIMGILMYCYIVVRETATGARYSFRSSWNTDKWVWTSFTWVMASMGSGTAFLFLSLLFLRFINVRTLIPLCIITCGIVAVAYNTSNTGVERLYNVAQAVVTLDEEKITAADHSASLRIVPTLRYLKMLDATSLEGWFGNGVDYIQSRYNTLFTGIKAGIKAPSGMLSVAIDYGLVPFISFICFSFLVCIDRKDIQTCLYWIFMVLLLPINSQLLWFTLVFLWTNKYIKQQSYGQDTPLTKNREPRQSLLRYPRKDL